MSAMRSTDCEMSAAGKISAVALRVTLWERGK
jgi:hypothetical protein